MPKAFLLTFLGAALACNDSAREPEARSPVRELIAERSRTDTRPDSFTAAADRGRTLGDSTAPVWVVVVSDFQCADCKRWHTAVLPLIKQEYVATGRVRLAFLNRPLDAHLNAMPTALAAACAGAQGKFWQTAARIFETESRWSGLPDARPFLDSLAIAAGAEAAPLRSCTERAQAMKLIRTDIERTTASGVDSLPTFFIGTHKVVGPASAPRFRAVLDSALSGK